MSDVQATKPIPQYTVRQRLIRIGVILFTLLLTFGALEVAVRAIPLYPDSFAMQDDALGWTYRPNASGTWFNVGCPREFTNHVEINSAGAHDVEHDLAAAPGTERVLFLGDSLVAALEVPLEQTFFRRLEPLLNEGAGTPTEVIALGRAGYGTAQEMILYEREGRAYAPDVVLLLFTPHNDFADNHPAFVGMSIDWVYTRPYMRLDESGALAADPPREVPMAPVHRFLLERSALYRFLSVRLRQFLPPVNLIGPEFEAARAESWEWTFAQLAALRDEVEADGARLGVVIEQSVLAPDERAAVHAQIAEGLDALGIAHFSLLEPFDAAADAGTVVRFPCDGHWTEAGHALAAEALVGFVRGLSEPD